MTAYCPVPGVGPQSPADNGYQGGFAAALMLKDLKLAMEAAASAGAAVPMGQRAEELYEAFVGAGSGGTDFSGIIRNLDLRWPTSCGLHSGGNCPHGKSRPLDRAGQHSLSGGPGPP